MKLLRTEAGLTASGKGFAEFFFTDGSFFIQGGGISVGGNWFAMKMMYRLRKEVHTEMCD